MPKGAIVAFLPDPKASEYHDDASLRKWLGRQGWAICDGHNGTPNLNYRMLLGTVRMERAGQVQGSRTHRHRFRGRTELSSRARQARFQEGLGQGRWIRIPEGRHEHPVVGVTDPAEHLPLSTRVLFIMKVR